MRYWLREISGWLLLILGVLLFYLCYLLLLSHDVTEAWPLALIGIVVFRAGVQLLKVAVAAELWTQAREGGLAGSTTGIAPRPRPEAPRRF
jgi:hypothetical protein